ncbi:MAG: GGDEF domain-containing protein [Onishia taeanensis]|uniref:GGDEF domain-containing protein n=1 Tax=Onishia taeanensis TaxID=284577 RepID=UPI003C7DFA4F
MSRRGNAGRETPRDKHIELWQEFSITLRTPDYRLAKAQDFGVFTTRALLITAVFVLLNIAWDYAIDPVHAHQAIGHRLFQSAAVLVWAMATWYHVHSWPTRLATVLVPLVVQASFIEVLSLLDNGNAFGIGGFLYFFIFVPFLLLAQSLRLSLLVLALITVFPLFAPVLGFSADLDREIYLAYMLISFPPVLALRVFFEYLYWSLYRYRRQIELQASTDGMTRLLNRRHFLAEGTSLLADPRHRSQTASLLFIDIDRFKAINDTYGHRIGDIAIDHLAELMRQCARNGDLIARYGGEEFLVLLPATEQELAKQVAQRLRRTVANTALNVPETGVPDLELTISVGVASNNPLNGKPHDIDVLIHNADLAVYAAKRGGRNRVVRFGRDMDTKDQRDSHAGDAPSSTGG